MRTPPVPARRQLLAAALALCGGRASAQAADPPGAQRKAWPAGRATPPLRLPAWEGPAFDLARTRGDVVLLNFWASWCEPCRAEMPSLELLAERHARDRLQVLAINFRETDAAIRRYLAQWPIGLPILRDADGGAAQDWQVHTFPTTFAIGRTGRVAFSVTGEVDWGGAEARRWIAALL